MEEKDGIYHVILAGATTKNLKSFERDFARLYQDLKSQYHLNKMEGFTGKATKLAREVQDHVQYSTL